ncbi:DUF3761 domain-containing protein [Mycobacterium sp.]|uniref:DUF3761 domain-containing protein n=1 Tax=Mycobacterium sp. TaxID=1785 RepID=UPI003F9600C9
MSVRCLLLRGHTGRDPTRMPYPQKGGPQPPNATAQCADGSWSFSEHPYASGTCHGHGGVQRYL